MRNFLLIIFCCFVTFAYADQVTETTSLEKIEHESAIFPATYQIPFFSNSADYTQNELSEAEVDKADTIFTSYLIASQKFQSYQLSNTNKRLINKIIPRLLNYRRQYFGITRKSDGHACVWINCFINTYEFEGWKDQLVEVNDGGSNFFQIKVDLDTGEAFDLMINSET